MLRANRHRKNINLKSLTSLKVMEGDSEQIDDQTDQRFSLLILQLFIFTWDEWRGSLKMNRRSDYIYMLINLITF